MKLIKKFNDGEEIVSMMEFRATIYLATTKCVYKLVGETFEPLTVVEYVENE